MNHKVAYLLAGLALVGAGCGGGKPKEISKAARAEAAQHVSEAEFAAQIRDFARAESLLDKAVELDPERPSYWLQLGAMRKRQGNVKGARQAYERAREELQSEYKQHKTPETLLVEIEVCVLLGEPGDAQKVLDRARKAHPDDRNIRLFVDSNLLEKMKTNPELKSIGL